MNATDVMAGYISASFTNGAFTPAVNVPGAGITVLPVIDGLTDGYGYDLNDAGVVVGTNFVLNPVPEPNIFHGFVYRDGATVDLNDAVPQNDTVATG